MASDQEKITALQADVENLKAVVIGLHGALIAVWQPGTLPAKDSESLKESLAYIRKNIDEFMKRRGVG